MDIRLKKRKLASYLAEDKALKEALAQDKENIKSTKEYKTIDAEIDALHQRMQQQSSTPSTLSVAIVRPRKWITYAVAAALIGVVATTIYYFSLPNLSSMVVKSNSILSDTLSTSTIENATPSISKTDATSPKNAQKTTKQTPSISTTDELALTTAQKISLEDFYNEQLKKISIATLSIIAKDSLLQTAKTSLKQGKIADALPLFLELHTESPTNNNITLYLALCYYQQKNWKKALHLLQSIEKDNEEVAFLLKEIK